jgi:hypothetical protein
VTGKRRRGAVCDAGEEGGSDKTNTAGLPRCESTREEAEIVAATAIYDVCSVDTRCMHGGVVVTTSPATQLRAGI